MKHYTIYTSAKTPGVGSIPCRARVYVEMTNNAQFEPMVESLCSSCHEVHNFNLSKRFENLTPSQLQGFLDWTKNLNIEEAIFSPN